ncbi:MAG: caspase family protein, partial [Verrucomicrobiota bacterium]
IALVIGNDDYRFGVPLNNAVNDAESIAAVLKDCGFEVLLHRNLGIDGFYGALDEFKTRARSAEVGLIYYAGHGVEVDQKNYLLPIDARLDNAAQLRSQTVSVPSLLNDLNATRLPAKLLILDCCRDNPLNRSWMLTRSVGEGGLGEVSDVELPDATMIMFAAAPGKPALDGRDGNSPFTSALMQHLPEPGVSAFDAFLAVSDTVASATAERQIPWIKFDGAGRAFRLFKMSGDSATTSGPNMADRPPSPPVSPVPEPTPESAVVMTPEVGSPPAPPIPERGFRDIDGLFSVSPYRDYNAYSKSRILGSLQERLQEMGLYDGIIDGSAGPGTHGAIVVWQRANGLEPTGLIDLNMLARLGLEELQEMQPPRLPTRFVGTYTQRSTTAAMVLDLEHDGRNGFVGRIVEEYANFGTKGPDGNIHANVEGQLRIYADGGIRFDFTKTYQYFRQDSVKYEGDYSPNTGEFSGEWYFPNQRSSRGTFRFKVQ